VTPPSSPKGTPSHEITPIDIGATPSDRGLMIKLTDKVNELIAAVRDLGQHLEEVTELVINARNTADKAAAKLATELERKRASDDSEVTDRHDLRKLLSERRYIRRRAVGVVVAAIVGGVLVLVVLGAVAYFKAH
jgi:hypothetical protein